MNAKLSLMTLSIASILAGCSDDGLNAEELARVQFNEDGTFIINPIVESEEPVDVTPTVTTVDVDGVKVPEEVIVDNDVTNIVTDLGEDEEIGIPETPEPVVTIEVLPELGVNDLACLVTVRGSLTDAVTRFNESCGITEYRDCDPVADGIYQCANYMLGETGPAPISVKNINTEIIKFEEETPEIELVAAPVRTPIAQPIPTPKKPPDVAVIVVPEPVVPEYTREADYCTANGASRAEAQGLFGSVCADYGFDLIDCDPISGEWKCASQPVGESSPVSNAHDLNFDSVDTKNLTSGVITYTPIKSTNNVDPLGVNWMDSYLANGKCYIESNLSYDIRNTKVSTSLGNITVETVNKYLRSDPDFRLRMRGDPIYNDVQCGNGPASKTGEEDNIGGCPGRVDLGHAGCAVVGPEWNFDFVQDITLTAGSTPSISDLIVDSSELTANNVVEQAKRWRDVIRNNRARVWISGFNDNVGAVLEYMAFVHPDADSKMVTVVGLYNEDAVDTDAFDSVVRHSRFIGVDRQIDIDTLIAANMQ